MTTSQSPERIAKRMARAGLCSRRDAERWIFDGRVTIDGVVLNTPAIIVTDDMDIRVDGKPITQAPAPRVWLYYKPVGLLTTHSDPQGRPTIFETLPDFLPRVISVGRLDLNSEGLLLLTNDGELSRYAELPATGWARTYRVRVFGEVDHKALKDLENGITVDDVTYGRIEAEVLADGDENTRMNTWITMTLYEGKNREIRKVLAHLGLRVNRLIRITYGPFSLGELEPGEGTEVPSEEVEKIFGNKGS